MPITGWSPSTVSFGADQTVYLVIDRFKSGTVYRETKIERTDFGMPVPRPPDRAIPRPDRGLNEALKPWANKPQVGSLRTWTYANFLRLTSGGSGTTGRSETLISCSDWGADEQSEHIYHQLKAFESHKYGLLATWETPYEVRRLGPPFILGGAGLLKPAGYLTCSISLANAGQSAQPP
jgi:hypothetical protein